MLTHSLVRFFVLLVVVSMALAMPIPRHGRKKAGNSDAISSDNTTPGDDDDSGDPPSSPTGATGSSSATPSDASFAAAPSIDVASILSAVNAATSNPVSGAVFGTGKGDDVQIYQLDTDVYAFTADMDVDCDGVDYQCKGNPDGQSETSYGALAATQVPFYVIPQSFVDKQKIKGNSLGAIICNNKMFYAIMGDTNGDSPEVIGEASLLLAQTCFPDEGLNGATGHDAKDVTYIVFGSLVPDGIDESSPTIDINALKTLGDSTLSTFKLTS